MQMLHDKIQPPNAVIPHKRPAPDEEGGASGSQADSSKTPKSEYATGRVICEVCSESVSFRDEASGDFTLKHWDTHRDRCVSLSQGPKEPANHTIPSAADAMANPPAKRRRAKRNEDQRIQYLRSDPYVAQFEAYRVLCASCDKWIRLRPNSTFCSIPWDGHKKSCLSRRIGTSENTCNIAERNAALSKDPDVRQFDSERILCNICDRWLTVHLSNHSETLQQWVTHRIACGKTFKRPGSLHDQVRMHPPIAVLPLSEQQVALTSPPRISRSTPTTQGSPSAPDVQTTNSGVPNTPSRPSKNDLNPTNFSASQESRQKSAEQRAATLRSDPLLGDVEPNRVLCTLCQKWVQLRQDSSYHAYPWLQHREKCLTRHHGRDPGSGIQAHNQLAMDIDAAEDYVSSEEDIHQRLDFSHRGQQQADPQGNGMGSRKQKDRPKGGVSTLRDRHTHRPSIGQQDLQSTAGRTHFIFVSIAHLFTTTYESSDDMTISALLIYLNAAMPPDKHEDFDTTEVVRAVATLQDQGEITFEGDTLRLLP